MSIPNNMLENLISLYNSKAELANFLTSKGITSSSSESLGSLVNKLESISNFDNDSSKQDKIDIVGLLMGNGNGVITEAPTVEAEFLGDKEEDFIEIEDDKPSLNSHKLITSHAVAVALGDVNSVLETLIDGTEE